MGIAGLILILVPLGIATALAELVAYIVKRIAERRTNKFLSKKLRIYF